MQKQKGIDVDQQYLVEAQLMKNKSSKDISKKQNKYSKHNDNRSPGGMDHNEKEDY